MEQNKAIIEELIAETACYLEKMRYSESRIKQYHAAWNHLKEFMLEWGEIYYTASVGEAQGRRFEPLIYWRNSYYYLSKWGSFQLKSGGIFD